MGILCQRPGRGGAFQALSNLPAGEYVFSYWVKGSDAGTRFHHAFEGHQERNMNGDVAFSSARAAPTTWEKVEGSLVIVEPLAKTTLYFYATKAVDARAWKERFPLAARERTALVLPIPHSFRNRNWLRGSRRGRPR